MAKGIRNTLIEMREKTAKPLSGVAYANLVTGIQEWVLKALANRSCWRRHLSEGEKGNGSEELLGVCRDICWMQEPVK